MSTYSYMKKGYIQTENILKQMEVISLNDMTEFFIDNEDSHVELEKMLKYIEMGDTIILCSLTVIELSRLELSEFLRFLNSKSIRLITIQESIDTQQVEHINFFDNCLVFLDWESVVNKNLIKKRLLRAAEKGIELGRPSIPEELIKEIRYLRNKEKKTIRYIADKCEVSIGTVHKYSQSL